MLTAFVATLVVVAPGVHAWWSSRKLLRHVDDPVLPDLLLRSSRGVTWTLGIVLGMGLVATGSWFLPLFAGALVSVAVGGFSSRRRLFEESWSLSSYLSHVARFYVGFFGGVIALAFLPQILRAAGPYAALAGALTGLALVAYVHAASRLLPWLLRARPLSRPGLEPLFERVLGAARTRRPRVFEVDAPGGSFVNAFALPSVDRPGVLLTRGLLDALEVDENAAIFAHEVAHLEHYRPRRLWAARLALLGLVALAVFLWGGPYGPALHGLEWVWTLVFALAGAGRAGQAARHETESDLRAVELGGDPEALVRGLVKLHALRRMPRRYSEWVEKRATHPSLARRIRAIRVAAAMERPLELDPVFVRASDGSGRGVVLDGERLHALAGVPEGAVDPLAEAAERRSLRYGELRELRIDAGSAERALVFREASGAATRMPIAPSDTLRVQEALDAVDDRVGYLAHVQGPPKARLVSLLMILLALSASSYALLPIAALALCLPAPATLAALGASGVMSAILQVLRPHASLLPVTTLHVALVALAAVACLAQAIRRYRAADAPARLPAALGVLVPLGTAATAVFALVPLVTSALPAMHLHLWSRSHPAAAVGLAAAAAALFSLRSRTARAGSAAVFASSLAAVAVGSLPARERLTDDVFRAPGAPLPVAEASLDARRTLEVPDAVFTLSLSPRDHRVAAGSYEDLDEPGSERDFHVETASGELVRVRARDLAWWDDERVLVVAEREDGEVLELLRPDTATADDEVALPALVGVELAADPASGRWEVTGRSPEENDFVVVRGHMRRGGYESFRFAVDEDTGTSPDVVSSEGIGLEVQYLWSENVSPFLAWTWSLGDVYRYLGRRLGVRRPGGSPEWVGATALEVDCGSGAALAPRFFCLADDGERTGLWVLDAETGEWTALGSLEGGRYVASRTRERLVLLGAAEGPVLVDPSAGEAVGVRLPRPERREVRPGLVGLLYRSTPERATVTAAAWSGEVLAVAFPWDRGAGASQVTLYELRH